jgi:hypothetical protein
MANRPRQIVLKGDPIRKEGIATETITPGDLLEWSYGSAATPTGGLSSGHLVIYLRKHFTAGSNAQKMFAREQDYIGSVPPGVAIDKVYNANDQVNYVVGRQGDEIFARIASNANVAFGDYLESNGDGTLRTLTAGSAAAASDNRLVARAMESTNVSPIARIMVEIL